MDTSKIELNVDLLSSTIESMEKGEISIQISCLKDVSFVKE